MSMTEFCFKRNIEELNTDYKLENKLKKYFQKVDNTLFIINERITNSYMTQHYEKRYYNSEKYIKKTNLYIFWKTLYFENVKLRAYISLYSKFKKKAIFNALTPIFIDPINNIIMEYYGHEVMEIIDYFSKYLDSSKYTII